MTINIEILRLEHGEGIDLPQKATLSSAGYDICAAIDENAPLTLKPMQRKLVPSGFSMQMPTNFEAQIRPRSGLALKHGITVLNSPGTIDSDYRGEVGVILINLGQDDFTITRGMRIAQMVISQVQDIELIECQTLSHTQRGEGGFGSTGTSSNQKIAS